MDIRQRQDIDLLVTRFYEKLLGDDKIAFIFTRVAQINLENHLPVISDFWESILLGNPVYKGNPMNVHFELHENSPLTKEHFEVWLNHWKNTVDTYYNGEMANLAKERASSIALLMMHKMKIL